MRVGTTYRCIECGRTTADYADWDRHNTTETITHLLRQAQSQSRKAERAMREGNHRQAFAWAESAQHTSFDAKAAIASLREPVA